MAFNDKLSRALLESAPTEVDAAIQQYLDAQESQKQAYIQSLTTLHSAIEGYLSQDCPHEPESEECCQPEQPQAGAFSAIELDVDDPAATGIVANLFNQASPMGQF